GVARVFPRAPDPGEGRTVVHTPRWVRRAESRHHRRTAGTRGMVAQESDRTSDSRKRRRRVEYGRWSRRTHPTLRAGRRLGSAGVLELHAARAGPPGARGDVAGDAGGAASGEVDSEQAVYDVRTLGAVVDRSLGQRWLQTMLLAIFAGAALLLAS